MKSDDGTTKFDQSTKLPCVTSSDKTSLAAVMNLTTGNSFNGVSGYVRATKAGEIFAGNDIYNNGDNETYISSLYFKVNSPNDVITFGVKKTSNAGEAYVDNFRLFYMKADPSIYLSANLSATKANALSVDSSTYTKPTVAYLRRHFVLNQWNSLCLPFNVSVSSLRQAFGNDVQLSKLKGVNDTGTQIVFEAVDLDDENSEGLLKNTPYIICPTRSADIASYDNTATFWSTVYNANQGVPYRTEITKHGPIYMIYGVVQDRYDLLEDYNASSPKAKGYEYTTGDGYLKGTCYYMKTSAPAGSYIVDNDDDGTAKMYYLVKGTAAGSYIYGTTWTIETTDAYKTKFGQSEANGVMTLSLDGEDIDVTAINGLTVNAKHDTNTRVYNLSGMAVGTASQISNLPKGIYIINHRKFVVK